MRFKVLKNSSSFSSYLTIQRIQHTCSHTKANTITIITNIPNKTSRKKNAFSLRTQRDQDMMKCSLKRIVKTQIWEESKIFQAEKSSF